MAVGDKSSASATLKDVTISRVLVIGRVLGNDAVRDLA